MNNVVITTTDCDLYPFIKRGDRIAQYEIVFHQFEVPCFKVEAEHFINLNGWHMDERETDACLKEIFLNIPTYYIKKEKELYKMKRYKIVGDCFDFTREGMTIRGEDVTLLGKSGIYVQMKADDFCQENLDLLSKEEILRIMEKGRDTQYVFNKSDLIEIIPLTDFERALLNYMSDAGYQYIARDKNKNIEFFFDKPQKLITVWCCSEGSTDTMENPYMAYFGNLFSSVTWEDKEPTKIEDLLQGGRADECRWKV